MPASGFRASFAAASCLASLLLTNCASSSSSPAAEAAAAEGAWNAPEPGSEEIDFDGSLEVTIVDWIITMGPGPCYQSPDTQFLWPPPEPTAMVRLDPAVFGVTLSPDKPVADVAVAVKSAFEALGHVQVGYRLIGCDGFAVISYLERIDTQGRPLPNDVRFLPPGASERWSLQSYLSKLLTAPEGKYRQIIVVGTDAPLDKFAAAPSSGQALGLMSDASGVVPEILREKDWPWGHRLVALIYEFDRPAGKGDPVRVAPQGLGATTHLTGSGLKKVRE